MAAAEIKRVIGTLAAGATLDEAVMERVLALMTAGAATPAQMGAFLMALRVRGETVEELTGAARMMRAKMTPVTAPAGAVDIVGTGGDAQGTYNVSTCACFVAAGAGLTVAKHGNRSVSSSLSGSSDVLAARRPPRRRPRDRGARDPRGGRRLHVGADASPGHEAVGADPRRPRHPHDLQPAPGRCAIRLGRGARCSASSTPAGSSRWPTS